MRERPYMGANIKGPYTTSIPAHAVVAGQKILYDGRYFTVTDNHWRYNVRYQYTSCSISVAETIHRPYGGEPNAFGIPFNEPIRVVVGSNTRGGSR